MKIRFAKIEDIGVIAQLKYNHWMMYRGMISDEFLDGLSIDKIKSEIKLLIGFQGFSSELINLANHIIISEILLDAPQIIVLETNDCEIIGFCMFGCRAEVITDISEDYDYQLHEIYIAPEHQKQGHGKILVDFVFTNAKERGKKKVLVCTHPDNKQAIEFYQNIGGKVIGENEVEFSGKPSMQIVLGFEL